MITALFIVLCCMATSWRSLDVGMIHKQNSTRQVLQLAEVIFSPSVHSFQLLALCNVFDAFRLDCRRNIVFSPSVAARPLFCPSLVHFPVLDDLTLPFPLLTPPILPNSKHPWWTIKSSNTIWLTHHRPWLSWKSSHILTNSKMTSWENTHTS